MERIAIFGSTGAGKTTLARSLHKILTIKVFHLDRVFWQSGWKKKSKENRIDILEKITHEQKWIIEGSYFSLSDLRLNAADTIVFLDIRSSICLRRIVKRNRPLWRLRDLILKQTDACQEIKRRDIPEGCVDKLTLLCLLKAWWFPYIGRKKLIKKIAEYKSKQVIWLHSNEEVETFIAHLEAHTNEKNNSSETPYTPKNRQLALARR